MSRTSFQHDAPLPEATLLARAQEGDRAAFGALVRMHQRRVRVYIAGYLHDRTVVDDLAQEVFLSAYRGLAHFRAEVPIAAWLLGITRKQILMHLRTQGRRAPARAAFVEELEVAQLAEAGEEPDEGPNIDVLRRCLAKLAPSSSAVVTKYYFQGMKLAEIARSLEKTEGALKIMLFRVRQALRECLRRAEAGDGAT